MSELAPPRRGRAAARVRLVVLGLFLSNGAAFGAWAAGVPAIKDGLGISDLVLGAALLCVAFGAMLAMPLAGWLGARRTPYLLTATGLLLALALPLPGLAWSGPALAAALLALGAAVGSMDVCMNARASVVEQGWGAAIMSSFHAAFSLGGLLGALLMAWSLSAGRGAEGGLLLTAALLLLTVAAHAALDRVPDLAPDLAGSGARVAWPSRAVAGIGVLCALAFMTEGAVADWSGVFLRTEAGFSAAEAAAGFAAFSAAMVLARLLGDAVVRRAGPGATLRTGALVAAAGIALAIAAPASGPAGFFLVGLGAGNVAPILMSAAGRSGPAGVASVATLGYAGMLLGPPLIGGLAEAAGLRAALSVLIAAMAAIGLAAR